MMKKWMAGVLALLICLSAAACGKEEPKQTESTSAPTQTEAAATQPVTEEVTTEAATEETRLADDLDPDYCVYEDGIYRVYNPNLITLMIHYSTRAKAFAKVVENFDYVIPANSIMTKDESMRKLNNGALMCDGFGFSLNSTFTQTCGAGMKDPDIWYASFACPLDGERTNMLYNLCALIWAASSIDERMNFSEDTKEQLTMSIDLMEMLFDSDEDSAMFLTDDLVLFKVTRSNSNQLIVGIDSAAYFNNATNTITHFIDYPF